MKAGRPKTLIRILALVALLAPMANYALVRDTPPMQTPLLPSSLTEGAESQADMLSRVLDYRADERAAQRALYLQAEQALAQRQLTRFHQLLPRLTDYPLYPYLHYADLKHRLQRTSRREIDQFLDNYATLPVANSLRRKVLRRAAKRQDWQSYLHYYHPTQNVTLQCHYLTARLHNGETHDVYAEIQRLWLSGRSRPNECDGAFAQWRKAGQLNDELIWQRVELALGQGRRQLAGYLARQLPTQDHHWAKLWIGLHRHPDQLPQRYKALLEPHPKAKPIFIDALQRLIRHDPQKAIKFWHTHTAESSPQISLNETEQATLYRHFAMALALRHQPNAEAWFRRIPPSHQTDTSRSWRVRAAIRNKHWQTVHHAINAMPEKQQQTDRWRYWKARALAELGQQKGALALLSELAGQRNYYGFLAADRLSQPYSLQVQPYQPSTAELFTLQERPDIRRAAELFQLGRLLEARREWYIAMGTMDEIHRQQAAKLAQLWNWNGQSILTMASTSHRDDLELRFPLLFRDEVLALSETKGLEAAWTYGVIRRESAFVSDARSPRGATGLMQLMPATAKHISRSLKVRYRGLSTLLQPETNLKLGTGYLARMMTRFDNQTVLATAAYNAGAQRVKKWLPGETAMDADRWIETIPYKETREYVSNVLAYTIIYADLLGQGGPRLNERMPPIRTGNDETP